MPSFYGPDDTVNNLLGITTAGQKTKAGSLPVVLPSDQDAIPVSLPSLPAGTAVIGHVIVDSAGNVAVTSLPALPAGSALIGHVIADTGSTTAVTSLPALPTGTNVIGHVIVDSAGAVSITSLPALPAGTNVIGHVISDSGSTTAVTGTVAVTGTFWQATQPVSGTVGISGTVPVSGTFWQATQPVSIAATVTVDSELTTADLDTGAGTDTRAVVGLVYGHSGGATLVSDTNPLPIGDNAGSLTVDAPTATPVPMAVTTTGDVLVKPGDSGNNAIRVNIVAGAGSGGTALADKAAFTEGTTSATPISGVFNETLGSAPSEDTAAAVRITAKRALHVQLRDSDGDSAMDDANNALRVNVVAGGAAGGTSSNFGSADPASGTAAGFSDGTNMREARVFDADTGGGTQYVLGAQLRKGASGGSVEAGTSTDPLRVDPTGTTTQPVSGTFWQATQPVSGTVTANVGTTNGLALDATLTGRGAKTQITDGTHDVATLFDADTGAGTQYLEGVSLRKAASGGSVEAGTSSDPLRVDPTGTTTQPVSAASWPLPSGAATSAKQPALGTAGSASADVLSVQGVASMTALKVDGSGVTQPVSAASLPLPSGASTAAKQPALGTAGSASADVLSVQGVASMTALKVDGSAVTQPVSAASLPLPTGAAADATLTGGTAKARVTDGTNTAAVKAASTAASATDPALVVALSPNSPLATGSNVIGHVIADASSAVIGHVIADSGSTTAVTGNVTVVQGTGSNLHAVLDAGAAVIGALTANQSTNVAQLAGTTTDTNSGNKSAGTLRVVLATDQPQLTNKLLVTPDANSAINVAQVAGASVSTAASGVQKVGVVGNAGATVDSPVGAGAAPTNAIVTGQVFNSAAPAPTTGQAMALQADQAGNLRAFNGIALAALSAWNSGTALNATQTIFTNSGADAVLVHLVQTTTLSAGAATFEVSYDNNNWVTLPAMCVLDPSSTTFAQIALPYTLQASTNKAFLIELNGAQALRIKLSTAITGSATVTPNYALLNYSPAQTVIALSPTAANFNINSNLQTGTNTVGNVGLAPRTSGGLSISRTLSAANTTGINAKGSAGQVYGWYISNTNAAARFVKLYNKATAPTVGTDTPVMTLVIPAGGAANVEFTNGIAFATGIGYGITTGVADNDTGAPAANEVVVNLLYV